MKPVLLPSARQKPWLVWAFSCPSKPGTSVAFGGRPSSSSALPPCPRRVALLEPPGADQLLHPVEAALERTVPERAQQLPDAAGIWRRAHDP